MAKEHRYRISFLDAHSDEAIRREIQTQITGEGSPTKTQRPINVRFGFTDWIEAGKEITITVVLLDRLGNEIETEQVIGPFTVGSKYPSDATVTYATIITVPASQHIEKIFTRGGP